LPFGEVVGKNGGVEVRVRNDLCAGEKGTIDVADG